MKKFKKRFASQNEAMKAKWARRIVLEKNYTQSGATWMAERLATLIDHMQYSHAAIAYHKQDGSFCLVTGTLRYYEASFQKKHDITRIQSAVVYWDVELQSWRTFQLENFLEWKPIV